MFIRKNANASETVGNILVALMAIMVVVMNLAVVMVVEVMIVDNDCGGDN